MTSTPGKFVFGAAVVAAALAFGSLVPSPVLAASRDAAPKAATSHAASDTDFSSYRRRYWRRYGYARPFVYRRAHFGYGRPYLGYRRIYSPYAYYRPRPYYYRPYYYRPYVYGPRPFFSISFGFGPRVFW